MLSGSGSLSVFTLAAALLLSPVSSLAQSYTALMQAACGPEKVRWHTEKSDSVQTLPAKPGSAVVYFITRFQSQGGSAGCGAVTRNGADGHWLGANCGSSWTAAYLAPGTHHLCVDLQPGLITANSKALWALQVEAGQTYYLQTQVLFLGGAQETYISQLNPDEGKLLVASLPANVSHPTK